MSEEERCCEAALKFLLVSGGAEHIKLMFDNMYFVYILRSNKYPQRLYIGLTKDIAKRLKAHNSGSSKYSKSYAPWGLETYIFLKDKKTAEGLERYLKSGSGFAFLKKRLLSQIKSGE